MKKHFAPYIALSFSVFLSGFAAHAAIPAQEKGGQPIPNQEKWAQAMITAGNRYASELHASLTDSSADRSLGLTRFDAEYVYYQMASYTNDPKWLIPALDAQTAYRDRYVRRYNGGTSTGPNGLTFTKGLTENYERTHDPLSRDVVLAIAKNAAYASDSTPLEWFKGKSAELAWVLMARLDAEKLGAPHSPKTDALLTLALQEVNMTAQKGSLINTQALALLSEALIDANQAKPDSRILPALQTAAKSLQDDGWDSAKQTFASQYTVGSTTRGTTAAWLNLLTVQLYGYLANKTGNAQYKVFGDTVFAAGVQNTVYTNSDQFYAAYRGSFNYIAWRSKFVEPSSSAISAAATDSTGGAGADTSGTGSASACNYTIKPIPQLDRLMQLMVEKGEKHAAALHTYLYGPNPQDISSDHALGATYYDAQYVFQNMAAITGNPKFLAAATDANQAYLTYYLIPNNFRATGYWIFPHGLYWNAVTNGAADSKDALIKLSLNAAFAPDSTPPEYTADTSRSRETAYNIRAEIFAERLNGVHRTRLDKLVAQARGHVDQWFQNGGINPDLLKRNSYVQSFMAGLTGESLIEYHQQTNDPQEKKATIAAIQKIADGLWNTLWDEKSQAFFYVDHDVPGVGSRRPTPDLNLLIAPIYAYLYHVNNDEIARTRAFKIFEGGVNGAWLDGAKQFNQSFQFTLGEQHKTGTIYWLKTPPVCSGKS